MNSLILLCSLLFPQPPALALTDAEPPKMSAWEKILNARFEVKSREEMIRLATYLPKLFPIHVLCQFKGPVKDAKPTVVFPGESVDAPDGGTLVCPGPHEVVLEKGTRLQLMQGAGFPRFVVEQGKISLTFGAESFFVETPSMQASITGETKEQTIEVSVAGEQQELSCERGSIAMDIVKKQAPGNTVLQSSNCLMAMSAQFLKGKRYLLTGDRVAAWDLVLAHESWKDQYKPKEGAWIPSISLGYLEHQGNGTVTLFVSRTDDAPGVLPADLECTLYAQKMESDPFRVITKFAQKGHYSTVEVDPSVHGELIFALCESPTLLRISPRFEVPRGAGAPQKK